MALRSPIVSVLGHVDHGKSSLLDAIRGSNIIATEAGRITQAIGASIVPMESIRKLCGPMLEASRLQVSVPGLLFIDTPGHAAFTNLRKRGGNLADIAIVVIDINEGFRPQTVEAIEILRTYKTPFVIAANKTDLVPGYRKQSDLVLKDLAAQAPEWVEKFEMRMYELIGKLHERFAMNAERFDRVEDFTKQVAIVPTSAASGQGVKELLMVLTGLAQKFLEAGLRLDASGPGKGTILEVKETVGFGPTIDVILYDGTIRRNDTIVIGGADEPIVTKVRALLEPSPLQEMRDRKSRYTNLNEATAATGLKIAAPLLEGVIAGMPLRVAASQADVAAIGAQLQAEVQEVLISTEKTGIIIKADTLGSLEAMGVMLKERGVPLRKAAVGPISKKDIAEAEANYEGDPMHAVILGFNIPAAESTERAHVITSPVIYELLDRLDAWRAEMRKKEEAQQLDALVRPCKIEVLQNCIFRQSNPCVVGVEVRAGTLTTGMPIMGKDGRRLTSVKGIQRSKESISSAKLGEQVAVSLPDVTAGRQINEHDVLYCAMSEDDFRQVKKLTKFLSEDEKNALREIAELMRAHSPMWGV